MNAAGTIPGAEGGNRSDDASAAPTEASSPKPTSLKPGSQRSRSGTKAITVHFPEEVRRQLKAMAGEEGRDVSDMVAEALNMLFARYRKPELAPRKPHK